MAATTATTTSHGTSGDLARASTYLSIDGMTCGNCARHVTDALQGVRGVRTANVSLDAHEATVHWEQDVAPDEAAIVRAVEQEGFGAEVIAARSAGDAPVRTSGWGLNLWVGVPVTTLLMFGEWGLQ